MHGLGLLKPEQAEEYRRLLESYHPNGQVVIDFARSNFGIIAGPTGSGKDTIRKSLMNLRPDVYRAVLSTTTRPPRAGEQDGVDYHYRSLDFIDQGLDERRFLQVELVFNQQLSGLDFADIAQLDVNHYGLGILVVQVIKKLRTLNANLKTIFIVPPSYEELVNRINSSRSIKDDEMTRRIAGAKIEIEMALKDEDYYLILNDDLAVATGLADSYFQTGERDRAAEEAARKASQEILNTLTNMGNV